MIIQTKKILAASLQFSEEGSQKDGVKSRVCRQRKDH